VPRLSLIEDLTVGPVPPGSNLLVEFDGASQWYNASITIAAGWLKTGGRISYNVTSQSPENIRTRLRRLGFNVESLEADNKLRIVDWYTATLGQKSKERLAADSLKVADLSIRFSQREMQIPESPDLLRMGDNFSTLARFNDERAWVEFLLTRALPTSQLTKSNGLHALVRGVHGDWVYSQLESVHDGIIDFKVEEDGKITRNVMRIRTMRDVPFDPEWHSLKIRENLEVTLEK
jgi:KaiC/GvpD/RAD55 family RecA-like ATPase